jgi:hypothetical protein
LSSRCRGHRSWLAAGKKGHVGAMLIRTEQPKALEVLAEAVL